MKVDSHWLKTSKRKEKEAESLENRRKKNRMSSSLLETYNDEEMHDDEEREDDSNDDKDYVPDEEGRFAFYPTGKQSLVIPE